MASADPEALVAAARAYLGVPYHHCGRNRQGVDCLGLLVLVGRDLGLPVQDEESYSQIVNAARFRAGIEAHCASVPPAEMAPGDVLLFSVQRSPQHLAMLTVAGPDPQMIHAYQTAGKVVEHGLSGAWPRRLVAVFRWGAA